MPTSLLQRFSRSRRNFLRQLGSFGAALPASALLTKCNSHCSSEISSQACRSKSENNSADFAFTDVTRKRD